MATASELLLSRPDDEKLKERLKRIDDDWALLESSLNSCEQQLTSTQTLLMPSIQAASELNTWMDRVEQTVKSDSGLQPKNADDVEQLHKKFKVRDHCDTLASFLVNVIFKSKLTCVSQA